MARHAVERHNEDFKKLFERHVASKEAGRGIVAETEQEAAELLGVTPDTIHAWLRPEGGKSAIGCPKWRVDMYRLSLPELSRLSDGARDEIIAGLRYLRGSGTMSPETVAAFDRLARKHKRAAA